MISFPSKARRRMLALVVCGAALAALPSMAMAQSDASPTSAPQTDGPPPPPPGGRHGGLEHRVEMLQRELNLTPDQTAKVKALFDAERGQMAALRSNSALSGEDRRTQMMAIHTDGETKLRALLTPDQMPKYDAMQARMRDRMAQRQNDQQPPPPPAPQP